MQDSSTNVFGSIVAGSMPIEDKALSRSVEAKSFDFKFHCFYKTEFVTLQRQSFIALAIQDYWCYWFIMQACKTSNALADCGMCPRILLLSEDFVAGSGSSRERKKDASVEPFSSGRGVESLSRNSSQETQYTSYCQELCIHFTSSNHTYNTVIDRLSKRPNVLTYIAVILGFCKGRKTECVIEFFANMVEKGCNPTWGAFTILIEGLAEDALEVLNELCSRGIANRKLGNVDFDWSNTNAAKADCNITNQDRLLSAADKRCEVSPSE
ncbi:pentatricopeptide repeat-containing protein [Tanacetum coccineum]